jgi:hypothetical protein
LVVLREACSAEDFVFFSLGERTSDLRVFDSALTAVGFFGAFFGAFFDTGLLSNLTISTPFEIFPEGWTFRTLMSNRKIGRQTTKIVQIVHSNCLYRSFGRGAMLSFWIFRN